MDVFHFSDLAIPPEARARVAQVQDPALWLLENKARSYNLLVQAPDGSGVDCKLCRNKGFVAEIDPEGHGWWCGPALAGDGGPRPCG